MHPASLSDSEGVTYAFLFSLFSSHMDGSLSLCCLFGFATSSPLILICLSERLLACLTQEAKLAHNPGKTRTKKKQWHDIGLPLVISSHVMIKVCDGYMKTLIVRGVLHGLYT